jgi:hypothetical protein
MKRFIVTVMAVALLTACSRRSAPPAAEAPRTEETSHGAIKVSMTVTPPIVRYECDNVVSMTLHAPTGTIVSLATTSDRFQGFSVAGIIDADPVTVGGNTILSKRILLTPLVTNEHRIGAIAVRYEGATDTGWFPTRPIKLELAPLAKPDGAIRVAFYPIRIPPTPARIAGYVALVLGMAALLILVWRLGRKIKRKITLMRMSPKERALHDLAELLARDLIGRHLIKEFYLELTMIVRRYIERRHRVRAPEQTTEEFLQAVRRDAAFSHDTVNRLKTFLEAADLVKFAGDQPDASAVDQATGTARDYIIQDDAEQDAAAGAPGKEPR